MSAMENIERVELGANSLKEVPKLTMNGLNNLFEFGVGEGVMTSVGGIVIGSDSLNSLSSFNFTRFSNVMDIDIGNRSLNIATSVIATHLQGLNKITVGDDSLMIATSYVLPLFTLSFHLSCREFHELDSISVMLRKWTGRERLLLSTVCLPFQT